MFEYNVRLNEEQIKNLLLFLDRVELKGHVERHAMNHIEVAIQTAVNEGKPMESETKK